jgi:hypothetical protein
MDKRKRTNNDLENIHIKMYFVQFVMNLTISLFLVTLVQGGEYTSFCAA